MSTTKACLSRPGAHTASLERATRTYLESTLEVLDDLVSELVDATPGRRLFWLHYRDVEWLRPLVGLGIELKAITVFDEFEPLRAATAVRALSSLVDGRVVCEFTRHYARLREERRALVWLDIRLLSRCIRLEHLFRNAVTRGGISR